MDLIVDNIPAALKDAPRWVVWAWVTREGKPTKPPYDVATGRTGDATDPALWMDFWRALEALPSYDGIGFAVGGSGFVGVDLDRSIDEDGNIAPWAEAIVRRLDSYSEVTPSGRGLRVWVRGKLPPGRRRKGLVEMYDGGRYFTVTGRRLEGARRSIEERTAELAALHADVFPPEDRPANGVPRATTIVNLDDAEILRRAAAAKNGAAFERLFKGDTSAYGEDSSAADLALCSHLGFWFGGDAAAVDRVFRSSGLYRAKWERADYRERTIAKALEGGNVYDPDSRRNGHSGGGHGGQPPPAVDIATDPDAPSTANRTDLGNARRLVLLHGADLLYCHPWGRWLIWAGDRWQFDERGAVYRFARSVVAELHREADEAGDDAMRKILTNWALSCESDRRVNAMVAMARHEPGVPVLPSEFDAHPWLLNCPNGTLDLKTGLLSPHRRDDLLMRRTGVVYDPDASAPAWHAFLDFVMKSDDDLIGFLRRAVGYAITGDVGEHALFFLHGRGQNGKSTFLNTLLHTFGDYAITVNAELLTAKNQEEHPTGVADLQGRRFVATIEVEDGRRLAESLVKSLTGGDRIRARRMRQDFFEFEPTHKLFLAANSKPVVRGTDEGIWRRIKMIPFRVRVPPENIDRTLGEKLRAEAPGILAWAVRGCLEWQRGGLQEPAAVVEATAEYRAEMDILAEFLVERCLVSDGVRAKSSELYRAYSEWCKAAGEHPLSMNKFGRLLTERGFGADKSNSTAWRLGLSLIDKGPDRDPDGPDF